MSVREPDLAYQFALRIKQYSWYANATTELAAITSALASDTTTHGKTIEEPAAPLKIHVLLNTPFTNDINLLVNKGKEGNLSPIQIVSAINDAIGGAHAPGLIDIPFVSAVGAAASCTQGNWNGAPSGYAYVWKRDGVTIAGATAASYTMVGADTGHQIGCVVTATNGNGSTVAPLSNTVRGP